MFGRPWRVCLLASLVLHAALLLMGPVSAQLRPGAGPTQPRTMVVRQLILRTPAEAPEPEVMPALPGAGGQQQAVPQPDLPVAAIAPPAPAAKDEAPDATEKDDAVYLPRRQLDQPPRPMASVDLFWPDDGPPAGHFVEVVSLFIDEAGVVQRVRIDGPGLPDSLQAVAREAFLRARFTPGLLAGQPVRSWIRLEVEFDATTTVANRGLRH